MRNDAYRGRRVLIAGGLGFIGSNIAHRLVGAGATVTIVDSLAPLYGGNRANLDGIEDRVTVHVADARDTALMGRLVRESDLVFNLAAQVSYIDSATIPFEDLDLNCRLPLALLELCREHNPSARVVFASSRLVLGRITRQPVTEDHPTEPLSLYGAHKLAAEKYHRLYAERYGLRTVVLRVTNPYGERQQIKHSKYSLPGWFMRQAYEGKAITIYGDGGQLRDYVYATDLADAFCAVGDSDIPPGSILNCGFGKSTPFREMVETIVRVVGRGHIAYVPWPKDYERVETGDVEFDTSRLNELTGWTPAVSLAEGIERMWRYFEPRMERYL